MHLFASKQVNYVKTRPIQHKNSGAYCGGTDIANLNNGKADGFVPVCCVA